VITQPGFLHDNGDRYLETVAEEKRDYLYPIGSLMKNGVCVAAGSDSPVGPPNPFTGIHAAVNRISLKGASLGPQERISLPSALALYTHNAARTALEESYKGSIESGKTADLVLLNDDLLRSETDVVREMKVALTLLDGRIVWTKESDGPIR
jgi:hypothetical protein